MNLRGLLIYYFVKEWGKNRIQRIVSNKTMPLKAKFQRIAEVVEILKACDLGYNFADLAEKISKIIEECKFT